MQPEVAYEMLIVLLMAIFALELIARRLGLPPAAAFILGGLGLALIPGLPILVIDPNLVLMIFLPPLLMNSGYFTVWREFRQNFLGIALLAVGAVIFTTAMVGLVARFFMPELPWAVCFAIGAIVSPPDAVAANAVLERLNLPGRMTSLLQGESLLNDATGLVLFKMAVVAALTGVFSIAGATGSFVMLTLGGAAFGFVVGRLGLLVLRLVKHSELAIIVTLLLPAIAYIGGERLHVSGVLATVVAGLLLGWHQHSTLSAATCIRAQAFWKVFVFLLESILFILIGLSLRGVLDRIGQLETRNRDFVLPVIAVVATVVLSRFIWVFGSDIVRRIVQRIDRPTGSPPSFAAAMVISWAGMRGVVTLAAALSLPIDLPGRDLVLVCAFAVIIVTVLVQGTTLGPLIGLLRLTGEREFAQRRDSEDVAWKVMAEAQRDAVAKLSKREDGGELHPRLLEQYDLRARLAGAYTTDRAVHHPVKVAHYAVVLAAVDAGRSAILELHRGGQIHDRVLESLEHELDLQQLVAEVHRE